MKAIIVFFIAIVTFILALIHIALYEMIVSVFDVSSIHWLIALRILFIILCLSFIAASILSNMYNTAVTRVIYKFSAAWLGFAAILFLASVIYCLGIIISGSTIFTAMFGMALLCIAFVAGIYSLIHAQHLIITRESVALPNLPKSWQGKTVVSVSDLHLGQVHGAAFARKVAEAINSLHPDIVCIAGDLYDGVKVDEDAIIAPLSLVKPPQGIYFVTGNHEEFRSSERFTKAISAIGIRVLVNELVTVDGLQIVGADDRDSNKPDLFKEILSKSGIDPSLPSILIKHQPTLLATAEKAGISLQLSGHTHRAQIWPFYYLTHWIYKGYDYGLKRFGTMQVCTSSGVGTWGPPMRLGTKSEIVAISLRRT